MSPTGENAIVRFSQARHLTAKQRTSNENIRALIEQAFDDDDFFDEVSPYLIPEGKAGNRQMDHGLIADMLFRHPVVGNQLQSFKNLNHKLLYDHVAFVLRKQGYLFTGGRVVGFEVLEDASKEKPQPDSKAA